MHGSLQEANKRISVDMLSPVSTWRKYRVQVPVAILCGVLAQTLLAFSQSSWSLSGSNLQTAILIGIVANGGALVWNRNMRHFPGTRKVAFLLPFFGFSWLAALLVITVFRLPYSSSLLAAGAFGCLGMSLVFNVWLKRAQAQPFLIIPSARVSSAISQFPELQYTICSDPSELCDTKSPIIADLHADLPTQWEANLVKAVLKGCKVYHVKQIKESVTGRVQIDHLSENALGTLAPDESYAFIRSITERLLALVLLAFVSPILLICSVAIKLESPGPALFRQTRIGHRGVAFTIYKMRTMKHVPRPATLESDITQENDDRITKFGKALRRSRIDELPQLINIIRGEMSFVGPRPETEKLSQWYSEQLDFYAYRHVVLPGITGWAQVRQGHVSSPEDVFHKLQYDFYYIKNFSFWLDVVIVLETIKVMIFRIGAK